MFPHCFIWFNFLLSSKHFVLNCIILLSKVSEADARGCSVKKRFLKVSEISREVTYTRVSFERPARPFNAF